MSDLFTASYPGCLLENIIPPLITDLNPSFILTGTSRKMGIFFFYRNLFQFSMSKTAVNLSVETNRPISATFCLPAVRTGRLFSKTWITGSAVPLRSHPSPQSRGLNFSGDSDQVWPDGSSRQMRRLKRRRRDHLPRPREARTDNLLRIDRQRLRGPTSAAPRIEVRISNDGSGWCQQGGFFSLRVEHFTSPV